MAVLAEEPQVRFEPSSFASSPPEWRGLARDEVRLLVGTREGIVHTHFRRIADHLRPGDVLVVNRSATIAGEVDAAHEGRPIVLHVGAELEQGLRVVELRTAPDAGRAVLDASPGDVVEAGRAQLRLVEPWPTGRPSSPTGVGNRLWQASVEGDLTAALRRHGRPIAYGYLDRRFPLAAYQTVFASVPGSAEMASAGRPFTHELVTDLVAGGVLFAPVTLHTGFSSQEAGEAPGPEWFEVPASSARLVNEARAAGARVIAVGTTATRAIESAVRGGRVTAASGWTERVVTPADPPRAVDGLVTGWHDPHASHLLLVESVAGGALVQSSYDEAVARGYLWHEFGDSALLIG